MKWRIALGASLGLLLAVPLAWLLQSSLYQHLQPPPPEEAKVSPILTSEQRKSLSTYKRRCLSSNECEPPLGCLFDGRYPAFYCADSECITDAQCQERHACRALPTRDTGPWVRRCVPLGRRAEGDPCFRFSSQERACRPGLLCGGDGWCGRPCGKDAPSSCPEGFFCSEAEPDPACLPTCEARGCPSGQECIRSHEDGASTCAVVHGHNCQQTPCPPGLRCRNSGTPERPGQAWLRCVQDCGGSGEPPCPEGYTCRNFVCERLCSPEQPDTCGDGYTCSQFSPDSPWICQPEWYHLY